MSSNAKEVSGLDRKTVTAIVGAAVHDGEPVT